MADSTFLNRYRLQSADIDVKIHDKHVDKLAKICFNNWKELYSLRMKAKDIEIIETNKSEAKAKLFLCTWKQRNGTDATYKCLIDALLEIEHREDAESVCEILMSEKKSSESSAALENGTMSAGMYIIYF